MLSHPASHSWGPGKGFFLAVRWQLSLLRNSNILSWPGYFWGSGKGLFPAARWQLSLLRQSILFALEAGRPCFGAWQRIISSCDKAVFLSCKFNLLLSHLAGGFGGPWKFVFFRCKMITLPSQRFDVVYSRLSGPFSGPGEGFVSGCKIAASSPQ